MATDFRINNLIAKGASFTARPTVNNSGVLLIGDSATGSFLTTGAADVRYVEITDSPVYQTGDQTISGTKTFHSGLLVQNGNVGIGTTTPTEKLEFFVNTIASVILLSDSVNFNNNAYLYSDGANILAQRNITNAQTSRIYKTYTNNNNFERLNLRWDTNTAKIGTEKGISGGLARDLVLETSGTERVRVTAAGLFSVNSVSFGRGAGNISSNVAIGESSLTSNAGGAYNLAIGISSLASNINGSNNISIGGESLQYLVGGSQNIVIGALAGKVSYADGNDVTGMNSSILIGYNTKSYEDINDTNSIVIGNDAGGMGSNSAVFGNDFITNTYLKGVVQIHKTNTDPSNYERIAMRWNGLTGTIGTSQTGIAFARSLAFETSGTARMIISARGDVSNLALFSTNGFAYTGIAPATTGDAGVSGQMAFSSNFLYRHNGTNWQRTGIGFANW